jgi:hypothetical protein
MDSTITYTNSKGEGIAFGDERHRYTGTDVHDREYEYSIENNVMKSMSLSSKKFDLNVAIVGGGLEARNAMFSIIDYDAAEGRDGSISIGDWSLACRCVKSSKARWWFDDDVIRDTLTFVAPRPLWRRERPFSFLPQSATGKVDTGVDFPFGFPFDFGASAVAASLPNGSHRPCAFRMTVYGPCNDPYVKIGGNLYQVFASVPPKGQLVIDSTHKAEKGKGIFIRDRYGNEDSAYSKRLSAAEGSGSYVFERIPAGTLPVVWPQTFGFDIALIDEEAEPLWS